MIGGLFPQCPRALDVRTADHGERHHLQHQQDPLRRGLLPGGELAPDHQLREPRAREHRQQKPPQRPRLINGRCNDLAGRPDGRPLPRRLDIVSVTMEFEDGGQVERFPLIEVLDVTIVDQHSGERHQGIVGKTSRRTSATTTFAVRLPQRPRCPTTSGCCTGSSSSTSCGPTPSGPSSQRNPSSASASRRARPTGRRASSTRSSARSTRTSTLAHRRLLRPDGHAGPVLHASGAKAPLAFYTRAVT